ncbi:MAG: glycosyltransferase 87 family protein [Acidimicrobiales bacterium]
MARRVRHLIAIGALSAAVAITLVQSQSGFRGISGDFYARYAAGTLVGRDVSPYDEDRLFAEEQALGSPSTMTEFYDPPPTLLALRALATMPPTAASLALSGLSLASAGLLGWLVAAGGGRRLVALAVAAVLVHSSTRQTLALGQTDLVVLAAVLLLARWQPVLAVAKPQTTGLVAAARFVEAARRRPVGAVVGAAAGTVAVLVATGLLVGSATWGDWLDRLAARPRNPGTGWFVLPLAGAVGAAVLVRGLWRTHTTGARVDLLLLAGGATSLLAAMGGWNSYWHLAQLLPLGALLLAVRRGAVRLGRHHQVLLGAVVACSLGDAFTPYSAYGGTNLWVPVAAVATLLVGLVALREVPAGAAAAVVVLNAAVTMAPLSVADRAVVPILTGAALLHLLLELRPRRPEALAAAGLGGPPSIS